MPLSTLASLTGLGTDHAVIETAVAVGKGVGGHITFLHARIDPVETAVLIETTFPQYQDSRNVLHKISAEQRDRSGHAKAEFDLAVTRHGLQQRDQPGGDAPLSVSWRETRSFFNETLHEARFHDLTIMGRDRELSSDRLSTVLMQSGRPLLLAPQKPPAVIGRHIAIAWKDSAEAARAVSAGMPLLAQAERISILSVSQNRAGDDNDRLSADKLAHALRWRGLQAEVVMEYVRSADEAHNIVNLACGRDADMLFMGAYGHSRFREAILGGVTREIISDCALPVFMFH